MQFKNLKEEKKLLNCICEVNIDGKMALVSLYDDLPHFEYDLTIDNLKNSITKLKTLIQELKQHIKKLENENTRFQTVNNVLSKNITSLYTTASSEIQRKDKIIDDLRKSQVLSPPSTSKMFSSTNNFQIENTKVNKIFENKNNTEKFKNTVEKTKVLNTNNNDNITTIVIKPTLDIPETIYSKRMCQKLAQQKENIESKKQMPQHIENTNTTDKITEDKNEELNKDKNILLEMSTSIHNESKDIINSTLVICESDITPSDCELDTTPVIQCDNQEKDKENISIESSSRLKQPTKLKKKIIISPATIGVQNIHNKTFKCATKLNQINNLASTTQCEIINSPEKQIIKSLNKDTLSLSTSINNNFPEHDPKTDNKLLETDILHNQQLFTSEKNNQIQSMNIEVEQFPIRRKKPVIEKDNNSLDLSNVRKRSCVTYISPSMNSEFNKSTENVKYLSKNKDREPSSPFQQKTNQSKYNLDTIKYANNITESKHLNNSFESSSKNTSVVTNLTNKTEIPSINIEVEQGFIFRQSNARKVIMHSTSDDKQETKKVRRVQLITIKDHYSKPVPSFNGAKKTEIDVSKKSILIEKVVESSSHFYVPQVKRKRTMNFSSADS